MKLSNPVSCSSETYAGRWNWVVRYWFLVRFSFHPFWKTDPVRYRCVLRRGSRRLVCSFSRSRETGLLTSCCLGAGRGSWTVRVRVRAVSVCERWRGGHCRPCLCGPWGNRRIRTCVFSWETIRNCFRFLCRARLCFLFEKRQKLLLFRDEFRNWIRLRHDSIVRSVQSRIPVSVWHSFVWTWLSFR